MHVSSAFFNLFLNLAVKKKKIVSKSILDKPTYFLQASAAVVHTESPIRPLSPLYDALLAPLPTESFYHTPIQPIKWDLSYSVLSRAYLWRFKPLFSLFCTIRISVIGYSCYCKFMVREFYIYITDFYDLYLFSSY